MGIASCRLNKKKALLLRIQASAKELQKYKFFVKVNGFLKMRRIFIFILSLKNPILQVFKVLFGF